MLWDLRPVLLRLGKMSDQSTQDTQLGEEESCRTFGKPTRQRDRACEQHSEDPQRYERKPERTAEVDFQSCFAMSANVVFFGLNWRFGKLRTGSLADLGRQQCCNHCRGADERHGLRHCGLR